MRRASIPLLPLGLLVLALLPGCRGQLRDHIGPRSEIIAPQLPRYGLTAAESQCVAQSLGGRLSPLQLRLLARSAGAVRRGFFYADRMTVRDLTHVASTLQQPNVPIELARAIDECKVTVPVVPNARVAAAEPGATPAASATRGPAWINLGAAASGQTISIDASTVEQEASMRRAWFRLGAAGQAHSGTTYLLRVDCGARTINSLARRKVDAAGAVVDSIDFGPTGEGALPVESGTVMEIAYLSLCT